MKTWKPYLKRKMIAANVEFACQVIGQQWRVAHGLGYAS